MIFFLPFIYLRDNGGVYCFVRKEEVSDPKMTNHLSGITPLFHGHGHHPPLSNVGPKETDFVPFPLFSMSYPLAFCPTKVQLLFCPPPTVQSSSRVTHGIAWLIHEN